MAIENFFTIQISQKAPDATGAKPAGLLSTGMPGLDFLNILFGQIDKTEALQKAVLNTANAALQHNNAREEVLQKKFELHLQKILAAHPEIAAKLESLPLDMQEQIVETLALNQKAFDDIIKTLSDGTITTEEIENGRPGLLYTLLAAIDKKQALMLKEKETALGGVALDDSEQLWQGETKTDTKPRYPEIIIKMVAYLKTIKPAELNEIQIKISALQEKDPTLTMEDALMQILGIPPVIITPPGQTPDIILESGTNIPPVYPAIIPRAVPPVTAEAPASTQPAPVFPRNIPYAPPVHASNTQQGQDAETPLPSLPDPKSSPVETVCNMPPRKNPGVTVNLPANIAQPVSGITLPFDYSLTASESFGASFHGLSLNSPANFASLVTQASHAHAPLPATQMISIAIHKAVATGETRNITLQLQPAELGRVEVRLSFGKDKTVKAVIIAEKPETLLMLQRDGHQLERTLQDSGLDSAGLSFELADSGYSFDRENQRGGGHDAGGTGAADAENVEIMESNMNWQVDPATGHMRYSILA